MTQHPIPPAIAKIAPDGQLTARQRRHILLQIALRRSQPGTGSSHKFMRRRTAMLEWPDLRQLLRDFDWIIVGGVATRAYMPERMTKDLDILIRKQDEKAILEQLAAAGYKQMGQLSIAGYQLQAPDGIEVDLILGEQAWLDEALAKPQQDPANYPVLALPYLVLMKMNAGRGRDLGDISTMLGWATAEQLDKVRDVVARYSPQDSEDLESMIFLGQQERLYP